MGRIITPVRITNLKDPTKSIHCDALVDTGTSYLVLPTAWKERVGKLDLIEVVELEIATQGSVKGEICGPVQIQIEGFRLVHSDLVFIDMEPENGIYEPLVGYIVLEQSQASIDIVNHRLIHIKRMDLK